ncbi:uncharacterized protein PV09_04948 [Verruconis gallopava]|uniref:Uncharacterized protein n=1 Tax=Verruconis gallopava TaxID=253628 RepID=A0A0D2ACA3_9PEZI|nr:uncharacterized protein PV09_04948 [Verruconis gallopava]KIW04140.1 hypothetical protein PV09_04948 [Verruconis gallopava]
MAQRIVRSGQPLRLAKDAFASAPRCHYESRRLFSAYQRLGVSKNNPRTQQRPSRPSLSTAQSMQMQNLRKEDLPDELGMMRITYILPPGPSLLLNPRLRSSQLYEFGKQYVQEILQTLVSKYTFWRETPIRSRPKHLKKSWMLFRPPRISLETFSHKRIVKDLHKRSYQAIQTAVETGNFAGIRETCGTSLQEHYARMVRNYNLKKEVLKWDVKYKRVRILSRKFGQTPMQFQNLPLGVQQVVARITSEQTLTPGQIVGKTKEGAQDVQWGEPRTRTLTEHVIMSRKYLAGRFEPWKIFGFRSPKGTQEELDQWREQQMRLPGMPSQPRSTPEAAT